jgi:hypothetical protein
MRLPAHPHFGLKTPLGTADFLREIVRFMVKTVALYSGAFCVVEDWDEASDVVRLSCESSCS